MVLEGLTNAAAKIGEDVKTFIVEKPIASAVIGSGVGAAVVGGGILLASKTSSNKKARTKKGRSRDKKFKSKQKHEQRYKRKRKYKVYGKKGYINPKKKHSHSKRNGKKIYYAKKTGQPYILKANGQARFIKGKRRK